MGNIIECLICGDLFEDKGSHPVICLKADCIRQAYELDWWRKSPRELLEMRYGAKEVRKMLHGKELTK